jgi:hypothetical protein
MVRFLIFSGLVAILLVVSGCASPMARTKCYADEDTADQYPLLDSETAEVGEVYRLQGILFSGFEQAGIVPAWELSQEDLRSLYYLSYCFRTVNCKDQIRVGDSGYLRIDALVAYLGDPVSTGYSEADCMEGVVAIEHLVSVEPYSPAE